MAEGFKHIVRICGTDMDGSKKLSYGLSKIKGIGINFSHAIIKKAKLDPDMRIGLLSDQDIQKLESLINSDEKRKIMPSYLFNRRKDLETGTDAHILGSDLTFRIKMDIDSMRALKSWKGIRHSLGLKVRGQKTRTSGRSGKAMGVKKAAIKAKTLGGT